MGNNDCSTGVILTSLFVFVIASEVWRSSIIVMDCRVAMLLAMTIYTAIHAAMQKFRVKVYFVTQDQFQHYLSLPGAAQEQFLFRLNDEKADD